MLCVCYHNKEKGGGCFQGSVRSQPGEEGKGVPTKGMAWAKLRDPLSLRGSCQEKKAGGWCFTLRAGSKHPAGGADVRSASPKTTLATDGRQMPGWCVLGTGRASEGDRLQGEEDGAKSFSCVLQPPIFPLQTLPFVWDDFILIS